MVFQEPLFRKEIYNINILTSKDSSSLKIQGYIDTKNEYLEGNLEFSF